MGAVSCLILQHGVAPQQHHHAAHDAHHRGRGERQQAGRGQRPHHVVEQPLHAAGKDAGLALLGVIALDHANAAQRFGEPPGDLGVDLAAVAKDRPDRLERVLQNEDEDA